MKFKLEIRDGRLEELRRLGLLLVDAYTGLPGFPTPVEQPGYYQMLLDVGRFADKPGARVLVALSPAEELVGGVVYFSDMAHYGSGGAATSVQHASGIRLLGISPEFRDKGAGRALTSACIELARENGHSHVILHTTKAMVLAWGLYERLGFVRAMDLDFSQQEMLVYGFKLTL